MISQEKLREACQYGNRIKNKAKRTYAFAYLVFLKNGASGNPPEHPNLSVIAAQSVRLQLNALNLWA